MDFASDDIKPIVLVGPYEHHSNLLPWREIGATVIHLYLRSGGYYVD
jgi:selenocysteine lyase/cysteine desulfurase